MRVLFCSDGSNISFSALKNFSNWVEDAIVDVITVIDWSFLPDNVLVEADGFVTSCANMADDVLAFAKVEVENLGFQFGEKIKHCGSVVEAILEQTEKVCYDFIILGSHGKKGIQKWLGSVSREIAYGEHLTTFTSKTENNGEKVLFTTDGSDSANCAIDCALEILDLKHKEIHLCTVNESPDTLFLNGKVDSNWILEIEKLQDNYSYSILQMLVEKFEGRGLHVTETVVLTGYPSKKIIDYSKEKGIDLIVSGSKNKDKMKDFLLGSVSKRILENAKCDVLIFK